MIHDGEVAEPFPDEQSTIIPLPSPDEQSLSLVCGACPLCVEPVPCDMNAAGRWVIHNPSLRLDIDNAPTDEGNPPCGAIPR